MRGKGGAARAASFRAHNTLPGGRYRRCPRPLAASRLTSSGPGTLGQEQPALAGEIVDLLLWSFFMWFLLLVLIFALVPWPPGLSRHSTFPLPLGTERRRGSPAQGPGHDACYAKRRTLAPSFPLLRVIRPSRSSQPPAPRSSAAFCVARTEMGGRWSLVVRPARWRIVPVRPARSPWDRRHDAAQLRRRIHFPRIAENCPRCDRWRGEIVRRAQSAPGAAALPSCSWCAPARSVGLQIAAALPPASTWTRSGPASPLPPRPSIPRAYLPIELCGFAGDPACRDFQSFCGRFPGRPGPWAVRDGQRVGSGPGAKTPRSFPQFALAGFVPPRLAACESVNPAFEIRA